MVTPDQAEGTTRLDVVDESSMKVPCGSDGAGASGGCVGSQAEQGLEQTGCSCDRGDRLGGGSVLSMQPMSRGKY